MFGIGENVPFSYSSALYIVLQCCNCGKNEFEKFYNQTLHDRFSRKYKKQKSGLRELNKMLMCLQSKLLIGGRGCVKPRKYNARYAVLCHFTI